MQPARLWAMPNLQTRPRFAHVPDTHPRTTLASHHTHAHSTHTPMRRRRAYNPSRTRHLSDPSRRLLVAEPFRAWGGLDHRHAVQPLWPSGHQAGRRAIWASGRRPRRQHERTLQRATQRHRCDHEPTLPTPSTLPSTLPSAQPSAQPSALPSALPSGRVTWEEARRLARVRERSAREGGVEGLLQQGEARPDECVDRVGREAEEGGMRRAEGRERRQLHLRREPPK